MTAVRIESIFGTALAKLILDKTDYQIVSPTLEQQKYLGIDPVITSYDVQISDLPDHRGVMLKGIPDVVRAIEKLIHETLDDAIINHHEMEVDAIYYAQVDHDNAKKNIVILNLGNGKKGIMFTQGLRRGDHLIVQVKELSTEQDKLPVCSDTIHLSSDNVILELNENFVRISKKIRGDQRQQLHEVGKRIQPKGFGLILRTSAVEASEEQMKQEIDDLVALWTKIETKTMDLKEPGILYEGQVISHIYLPYKSKLILEKIRGDAVPTFPNYYILKSYSRSSYFATNVLDKLIGKLSLDEIRNVLQATINEEDYTNEHFLKAEFKPLNGESYVVGLGTMTWKSNRIITTRILSQNEIEDLAEYNIPANSIITSVILIGSWTLYERILSPQNEILLSRVKIISPIDLAYRGRIFAFDYGIEIIKNHVDDDKKKVTLIYPRKDLDKLVETGVISPNLNEFLKKLTAATYKKMEETDDPILVTLKEQ